MRQKITKQHQLHFSAFPAHRKKTVDCAKMELFQFENLSEDETLSLNTLIEEQKRVNI